MAVTFMAVTTAVLALVAALTGWRQARAATERLLALESVLADALDQALESESRQQEMQQRLADLRSRVDRLALKRARSDRQSAAAGYQDAIRLSQDGAADEVLMDSCGLSRGEARLIRSLYRRVSDNPAH